MKVMNYAPALLVALTLMVAPAFAAFDGPNTMVVTEISSVATAPDECLCILEGNIVEKVKGEKDLYVMKDTTGQICVEIEDVVFMDKDITPKDKIRAHGRIEKGSGVLSKDADLVEIYFFEVI